MFLAFINFTSFVLYHFFIAFIPFFITYFSLCCHHLVIIAFIPFVFSLFVLVFSKENKAKLSSLRDEKRPHVVRKVVM
jgi:hypothetical protein